MRNSQKPEKATLNKILSCLREGEYVIPDFQRDFEWKPWDISALVSSILRDYYIGSLLLWRGSASHFDDLSCEPVYGREAGGDPKYIVLDGQQRLTAINYAFMAPDIPLPGRKNRALYFVRVDKFMAGETDDAVSYDWLGNRMRSLLENRAEQFERHIFPCRVVGETGWSLFNWLKDYESFWRQRAEESVESDDETAVAIAHMHFENATKFAEVMKGATEEYQVSYIELDRDLELEKVCDIFTQINSRGVQLDSFDLINAMVKPKGLQLRHMWREASSRLAFPDTEKMNVYILQVMSLLAQGYCSPKYLYYLIPGVEKPIMSLTGESQKTVLIADDQAFLDLWQTAVDALARTIDRLRHPQEFGAISPRFVPYNSILPAFAAMNAHLTGLDPRDRLSAERKIRHWYWASAFRSRYSGSVESTAARDFNEVREWISNGVTPSFIHEFNATFRTIDFRSQLKSGSSIYSAVFNLFVIAGARDWMNGTVPMAEDVDDHHIVPVAWGRQNLQANEVHTILNRSPLSSHVNRHVISDKLPNTYLPELIERHGRDEVQQILETHFISAAAMDILLRDPFTPDDFAEFLRERQRSIENGIEGLIIKQRLDMSAPLRKLDEMAEHVEKTLRDLIAAALEGEHERLPQHVGAGISQRIKGELRRNPNLDDGQLEQLRKRLDYADLRDLEAVVCSKTEWAHFSAIFGSKETFSKKFDQLATLRNAIAHNRELDRVVRMEGEAALEWFGDSLKLHY